MVGGHLLVGLPYISPISLLYLPYISKQESFVAEALLEYGKLAETSLGPQMLLSIGIVAAHVHS